MNRKSDSGVHLFFLSAVLVLISCSSVDYNNAYDPEADNYTKYHINMDSNTVNLSVGERLNLSDRYTLVDGNGEVVSSSDVQVEYVDEKGRAITDSEQYNDTTFNVIYRVYENGVMIVADTVTFNVGEGSVDDTPPVITLKGSDVVHLEQGQHYEDYDPGWTAQDDVDGDLTDEVEYVDDDGFNQLTPGSYTITYSVSDAAGNVATATRVFVVGEDDEDDPPVLSLEPPLTIELPVNGDYSEPGYTATDPEQGDITSEVVVDDSELDLSSPGTYTIYYSVTDSSGNTDSDERTVTVEVQTNNPPEITLQGSADTTVPLDSDWTEPGYTAYDEEDGDITDDVETEGSVNTSAEDVYTITYSVTDSRGGSASEDRVVEVVDTTSEVVEGDTTELTDDDKNFSVSLEPGTHTFSIPSKESDYNEYNTLQVSKGYSAPAVTVNVMEFGNEATIEQGTPSDDVAIGDGDGDSRIVFEVTVSESISGLSFTWY